MRERTDLQVILDHYAGSARHDLDAMTADFDPELVWVEMAGFPYAGTFVGPDEVRAGVFERLGAEWDDYEATPDQFVVEPPMVVAFGRYTGVFRETGRAVDARFTHRWTLARGKVVGFEQFTDTALFARATARE